MTHVDSASFQRLLAFFFFVLMVVVGTILKKRIGRSADESSSSSAEDVGERNPGGKSLRGRKSILSLIGVVVAIIFLISVCGAVAAPFLSRSQQEPLWEPELPQPIKDREDVAPQGPGSLLRSFSLTHYDLRETTAEDKEELRRDLINKLDEYRQDRTLFDLPDGFSVRGKNPTNAFKAAETLPEYDQQILDAYNKVTTPGGENNAYQYHRISITALNCLDRLSRDCKNGVCSYDDAWEDFLYYGELAVWGLVNEYVCSNRLSGGEKVDLFYRIAQVYDHVGTATTDDDPPFKHEMYLVASAFLELSFLSLKTINFTEEGHEYRSSVWDLYMTMDFRMGKYVKHPEGFFKSIEECKETLKQLDLTEKEDTDVQGHMDDLLEWREIHEYTVQH